MSWCQGFAKTSPDNPHPVVQWSKLVDAAPPFRNIHFHFGDRFRRTMAGHESSCFWSNRGKSSAGHLRKPTPNDSHHHTYALTAPSLAHAPRFRRWRDTISYRAPVIMTWWMPLAASMYPTIPDHEGDRHCTAARCRSISTDIRHRDDWASFTPVVDSISTRPTARWEYLGSSDGIWRECHHWSAISIFGGSVESHN